MVEEPRSRNRRSRCAIACIAAAIAVAANAAPWTPTGPADGGRIPAGSVATHPALGGQAMIVGGEVAGLAPAGTFVTTDGGAHWAANARHLGDFGQPMLGGAPAIAYAESGGTIVRSVDLGRSWAPLALPFSPALLQAPGAKLALRGVNPHNGHELVVSLGAEVAQSSDGGATWVAGPAPGAVTAAVVDWSTRTIVVARGAGQPNARRPLADVLGWAPSGMDAAVLAAGQGVVLYQDSTGALYRSTDGTSYAPVTQVPGKLSLCDLEFASAPSARVYGVECASRRVLVSHDAGASFVVAGLLPLGSRAASIAIDAFDAARIYVATSRGVFRSTDGGSSFAPLSRAAGAPGQGRTLILDRHSAILRYLTDPPGVGAGYARSTTTGTTWTESATGRRLIAPSRERGGVVFGAQVDAQGNDAEFGLSDDGGVTWHRRLGAHGPITRFGPLAYGATPGEIYLYADSPDELSADARLYRSLDDGESWTTEGDPPPIRPRAMATTPVAPSVIYVGGAPQAPGSPQLWRTDDIEGWLPVATFPGSAAAGSVGGNEVETILVDPVDAGYLWVGLRHPPYVMFSVDGGSTWTPRASGLGAGPITSLRQDPDNRAVLYATQAGGGVFRSANRGGSWLALDEGLHEDVVLDTVFDRYIANRLYASTASGLVAADVSVAWPTGDKRAIEFHHAEMDHYFVSTDTVEIGGLDTGVFPGWSRTGRGFRVAAATAPGASPTCRLFGLFGFLSTHVYTPYPAECEFLKTDPRWTYETIAFGLALPDAATRGCPPQTRPLRRYYNNFALQVPNHRFTTEAGDLVAMEERGWIFEGEAATRVFACVPY